MAIFVLKILLFSIVVLIVLFACTRAPNYKPDQTFQRYFDAQAQQSKTASADAEKQMLMVFGDMKKGANAETIRQVYAEKLYFNDTFKIITERDELIHYLTETGENAHSNVDILEVIKSDSDYYVRWQMHMAFTVAGKDIESDSIGISQLRFNKAGQITFQQDFWNSAEAFYEHLPFIGRFLIKIKQKL